MWERWFMWEGLLDLLPCKPGRYGLDCKSVQYCIGMHVRRIGMDCIREYGIKKKKKRESRVLVRRDDFFSIIILFWKTSMVCICSHCILVWYWIALKVCIYSHWWWWRWLSTWDYWVPGIVWCGMVRPDIIDRTGKYDQCKSHSVGIDKW